MMIAVIVDFIIDEFRKKSFESYTIMHQFKTGTMGFFNKYLVVIIVCFHVFAWSNDRHLYILHTNNTNGALENCYCPGHPYGAIEKRSVFINQFIKKHPNTIVLDAGDLFSVTQRPFLDSLIIEAYAMLPYDAILVGDQELSRTNIKEQLKKLPYPALAGNLKQMKELGLSDHINLNRGGVNIAIVGTLHPNVFRYYPKELREKFLLSDPVSNLKSFVEQYSDSTDLIIALTHEGHDKDITLSKEVNGINVIIGSHSQSKLDSGSVNNHSLIVQAGKEGYYIGIVDIVFDDKKNIVSTSARLVTFTLDMPDDPFIMELISALEKKTGHINRNKLKYLKK